MENRIIIQNELEEQLSMLGFLIHTIYYFFSDKHEFEAFFIYVHAILFLPFLYDTFLKFLVMLKKTTQNTNF